MNTLEKKQRKHQIANKLVEIRKQRSLNQSQVADTMGCDQSLISKYESADAEVSLDALIKLADIYGCSVDYLLGRQSSNTDTPRSKMLAAFDSLNPDEQKRLSEMMSLLTDM